LSRGGHKNSVLANDYASYNLLFNRENAKRPEFFSETATSAGGGFRFSPN